ncbi:MAG: helix-turn-helix transcriptional regulator [Thermoleophilia bacterium]|nr:helix-turn-helix transcriptional regulator [Thermoleophilia bacterium]
MRHSQDVAKYGVQATTTSRIAASAGVSEATLYRYFPGRHHMLSAALDLTYERILRLIRSSTEQNAIERLRSIARFHIVCFPIGRRVSSTPYLSLWPPRLK